MAISAQLVKELREMTGAGMMECKKALVVTEGNLDKAVEELRKSGQAKAVKKSGRTTAEGIVVVEFDASNSKAVIVEINCETDFVAREEKFVTFANNVASIALNKGISDVETLGDAEYANSVNVETTKLELISKIGENVSIRRLELLETSTGALGKYMHAGARIGSVIAIDKSDMELATDLAMQVTAMNPECVSKDDVDPQRIQKEKDFFLEQAQEQHSKKPKEIVEKIIQGQVNKSIESLTLHGQAFVKDQNIKVEQLLKEKGAKVVKMVRYAVGEGIEKKETDFVAEVMSQVNN
ncbi:MAG: elongation factor Ts [Francisellaceae bacterium]|jgi:elongation factor Ts|nr:elongation factor Ts [Francisellaceae bacterium]MBT6206625.1 elongation factor Ts [Francisellaceae bacterium]MBT6539525.1 elongation factor Ts [Francisellaceae bacterium]